MREPAWRRTSGSGGWSSSTYPRRSPARSAGWTSAAGRTLQHPGKARSTSGARTSSRSFEAEGRPDLEEGRLRTFDGGASVVGADLLECFGVASLDGLDDPLVEVHRRLAILRQPVRPRDVRVGQRPDSFDLFADHLTARQRPQRAVELVVQLDDLEPVRGLDQVSHAAIQGAQPGDALIIWPLQRAKEFRLEHIEHEVNLRQLVMGPL